MEEEKLMAFGKIYRVGNYKVFKFNRTIPKKDLRNLRTDIPKDLLKYIKRGGVPYIKIEAVSGVWAIEFCCNTLHYQLIDRALGSNNQEEITTLHHVFNMFFTDTCVPGDGQFQEDKAKAYKAFIERQKANPISDEDDAKIIENMKAEEEARANIVEMANTIKKEAEDNGGN